MKKLKKIISLLCVAALSISMLAGCGKDDADVSVVRVWSSEGGTKEFMEEKVNEFNKTIGKDKKIKIDYKVIMSGLDDMTKNAFENGDGPEIFGGSLNTIKQYRKLGYALPISDLQGGQEYIDSLGFEVPNSSTNRFEDKVYSFPVSVIVGGLVYNKDLFKAIGFTDENGEAKAPQTWDEVIEISKKIREHDKTKYGIAFPMKDGYVWGYAMGWAMSASSNGTVYDWENETISLDSNKDMLNIMLKIKEDDSCFPGSESLDNDTLRLQFAEGNIGMFMGCSWDVGVLTNQFPAKCDWDVAEYPVVNVNEKYLQNGQLSSSMSIGKTAKKSVEMEKAVMEVYEWLYSDELSLAKYELGQAIPYSPIVAEKAKELDVVPQWTKFCEIQAITRTPGETPSIKLEGDTSGVVYEKIWMGDVSIEDAFKDMNARYSDAFKKAISRDGLKKEDYPTIDYRRK